MASVTQRIGQVRQPYGGYIKPSEFRKIQFDDNNSLNPEENIHASLIGLSVDYMTRFMQSRDVVKAFEISCLGAVTARKQNIAEDLLRTVHGLDDASITSACKLASFDVWYRNPLDALLSAGCEYINPDSGTIENIRVMVMRSLEFFSRYGPVTADGFTFEPYGYTETVNAGDGDFLTKDTLWDFKTLRSKLTSKHTLQLLMYWIMGKHSGQKIFRDITRLGVFNPRMNAMFLLETEKIPQNTVREVEDKVICY